MNEKLDHWTGSVALVRDTGPAGRAALLFGVISFPTLAAGAALYSGAGMALVALCLVATAIFAVRGFALSYPHRQLGLCNIVTSVRAAMVCVLAGALVAPALAVDHALVLVAIAGVALAMDGLDGFLARKTGLTSDFGAKFDVETDALISAVLALLGLLSGLAGPAVLILGFARYAFLVAIMVWPWLDGALPERFHRKAICVFQILALIYVLVPGAVGAPFVVSLACAAVLWSFAVDIRWLAQQR
ncbi:MAG: CDP-alcohol phosphatidyltransferase family protein [Pseudomonadota bacterium]